MAHMVPSSRTFHETAAMASQFWFSVRLTPASSWPVYAAATVFRKAADTKLSAVAKMKRKIVPVRDSVMLPEGFGFAPVTSTSGVSSSGV